jgi:hypothetical protein
MLLWTLRRLPARERIRQIDSCSFSSGTERCACISQSEPDLPMRDNERRRHDFESEYPIHCRVLQVLGKQRIATLLVQSVGD